VNDILKQRLVGALILLALGVVFWPIIFVQPEDRRGEEQLPLPPPPAVVTESLDAPDAAGLRASPPEVTAEARALDASVAEAPTAMSAGEPTSPAVPTGPAATTPEIVPDPDALPARQEPPQGLAMDADGVPVAWTLQVATVSSAEKADALRRRLLEKQQKAYVTTVSSGAKTLYRVCIGPKFERIELERLQPAINAEFGVNSLVVRYVP